jgi:hypothetical protein
MRKTIIATLLVASLAIPSFAAPGPDSGRRAADRSVVTRVMKMLKRLGSFLSNEEITIPKP